MVSELLWWKGRRDVAAGMSTFRQAVFNDEEAEFSAEVPADPEAETPNKGIRSSSDSRIEKTSSGDRSLAPPLLGPRMAPPKADPLAKTPTESTTVETDRCDCGSGWRCGL